MAWATSTYLAIAAAAAVASAGVGTAGAIQSGKSQEDMAEYNAAVATEDAKAAKYKAGYDEQAHRDQVRKTLSAQRAAYGASGVDMTGSPLLVMEDTAQQGELDALAIRYGGDVEASRQRSAANLYRMQGSSAKTSSYYQAGSTLLSGASSTLSNYNTSRNIKLLTGK